MGRSEIQKTMRSPWWWQANWYMDRFNEFAGNEKTAPNYVKSAPSRRFEQKHMTRFSLRLVVNCANFLCVHINRVSTGFAQCWASTFAAGQDIRQTLPKTRKTPVIRQLRQLTRFSYKYDWRKGNHLSRNWNLFHGMEIIWSHDQRISAFGWANQLFEKIRCTRIVPSHSLLRRLYYTHSIREVFRLGQ